MKSFKLEKSWRSSGTGNTTFNATGNFSVPFGKSVIGITGRGGTGTAAGSSPGNPNPPNATNYNPYVPGFTNPPSGNTVLVAGTAGNYVPPSGNTVLVAGTSEYTNSPNPTYYNPYVPAYTNPGSYGPPQFIPGYTDPNYGYAYSGFYIIGDYYPGNYVGASGGNVLVAGNPGNYVAATPTYYNPYVPGYTNSPNATYYNPYVAGNYVSPSGGNVAVAGNATPPNPTTYNPATPGTSTTVLGVYFPGGASSTASVIPLTTVNADAYTWPSSYSVTVPSGGYITIQVL
jgi:hypothetical protein